jgi:hypothetical protein
MKTQSSLAFTPFPVSPSLCSAATLFLCAVLGGTLGAHTIPFVQRPHGAAPAGKLENFLGFSGVNAIPADDFANEMGMGWNRNGINWADAHTAPGVYDWAAGGFDQFLAAANAEGLKVCIMVRNTPGWARTTTPYEFVTPGKPETPGGERWVVTPNNLDTNGYPQGFFLQKFKVSDGSLISETQDANAARLRPSDAQFFTDFMLALVARYSQPPYNVTHFQMGNEHRPESGHYPIDSTENFARYWFLPAAVAVHQQFPAVKLMDCFPGNTTTAQLTAFETFVDGQGNRVLDHLNVHVHHYGNSQRWRADWTRYEGYGIPNMAHWATEYASATTQGSDRFLVSYSYPAILEACLLHDWDSDVDKYKIQFWPYSGSSGTDKALVFNNLGALSDHGRQMRTLYSLLHGGMFRLYAGISTSPDAEANDNLAAFETDRGLVVAIGLRNWNPGSSISVTLPALPPSSIALARSVDCFGTILETLAPAPSGNGSQLTLNLTLLPEPAMETVFLEIHRTPIIIGGGDPPAPVSGGSYTHTFTVTGATGAVTWTLASGTLPPGLTLSSGGVLSGTPTTPGTYVFTVQATDSLGLTGTQNVTLATFPTITSPTISVPGDGTVQITWPTTNGFAYQIEWSPDLAQWFGIGTPAPATGAPMAWTDDGSQTGTQPIGSGKRFYRLRISIPSTPTPSYFQ